MNIGEADKPADVKVGEEGNHILDRRLRPGEVSADVLKSVVLDLKCAARLSHVGQDATIDQDDIKAIVDLIRGAANKLRDEATLTDQPRSGSADFLKSLVLDLRCAARLSHLGQDATIDQDDIKAIADLVRRAANKLRDDATLTAFGSTVLRG